MKMLLVISFLGLLCSCSTNGKLYRPYIPLEYELPLNQLRQGVTTVYVDETGDSSFSDIRIVKKNGKEFISDLRYAGSIKKDSTVTGIDEYSHETYTWVEGNLPDSSGFTKLIEEEYKRIDDGTKLGKEFVKRKLESEGFMLFLEGTTSYVKDTSIMLGDSMVNCLVLEMKGTSRYESRFSIGDSLTMPTPRYNLIYYGKGLGIVRIVGSYRGTYQWQLKEIRPLRKND